MKRKLLLLIAICILCGGGFFFLIMVRAAKLMSRGDIVVGNINHLAVYIEAYKDDHDKYPVSLEALESGSPAKEEIHQILHDSVHDNYEYKLSTNGFVISVTAPNTILYKWDKITMAYKLGDVMNNKVPEPTHE